MGNLIGYKDLFDFSDDKDIQAAIQGIADLKKTYLDFKVNVTGSAITMFEGQLSNIASEVKALSAATKELNVTNEKQQATLLENLDVIQKLKDENEKLRSSKKGAKDTEKALEDSVNGLNAKLKDQLILFKQMSKDADPMALKKLASEIQVTRYEITELNNATKGTTSSFQAAKGSYNALDAETKRLIADLKMLDNGLDSNNQIAKQMQAQILANTTQLKAFDANMGQHFRNVGNYSSAFTGYANTLRGLRGPTKLLGEALGISATEADQFRLLLEHAFQGLAAISRGAANGKKDIDALASATRASSAATAASTATTEVNTVATEANATAQEASAAASTLAARAMAFMQTASLVLGFTAVAAAIAYLIYQVIHFREEARKAAEMQNILNDVMANADKDAGKQITSLDALYHSAMNANIPMSQRLEYVKEMQKEFPAFFNGLKTEEILNGLSEKSYLRLRDAILQTAKARAAKSKIDEIAAKQLDLEYTVEKVNNATANETRAIKGAKTTQISGGTGGVGGVEIVRTVEDQKAEIERRRKNKLDEIKTYKDRLQSQADFLVKFAGGEKAIADSIVTTDTKQTKDTSAKDAREAARKLAEAIKKQDELIQASAKYQIAQAELVYSKSAQQEQDGIDLETKRLSILEKSYTQRLGLYKKDSKQYYEILGEKAKAEKDNEDAVLKIHEKGIDDRTKIALAAAQADYNRTNQGWVAEAEFETLKLKILEASFDERLALYKNDAKKYQEVLEEKVNAEAASAEKQRKIRLAQNKGAEDVANSQKGERDSLFVGNINVQKASGAITAIQAEDQLHNYRAALIEEEIRQNEVKGAKLKAGDADYFENLKALGGLRKQLADENAAYEVSKAQEVHEKELALKQAIFDFIKQGSQSLFEIGREINQANVDDLNASKEKELSIAGNNATARAQIEANYQKKLIDLKRKQAIYDKLEALMNIGINTAVAVTAAWKVPLTAPFMVPLIIATGALQAAAVIAKPLPKYYKGRGKGKQEWAEVNELGTELIENDGKYRIAGDGKKTATLLSPNDIVHTAEKSNKIIKDISNNRDTEDFFNSLFAGTKIIHSYERKKEDNLIRAIVGSKLSANVLGSVFEGAINKMERDYFTVNERGFSRYTKMLSGRIQHLNSRNSINGNG